MIGAILGDMIGAPYEFDQGNKTKEFPLFSRHSEFTDDSVMTIAVAEALMDMAGRSDDEIRSALAASMQKWGSRYPYAGYGGMFDRWLHTRDPKPYGSFGNGSAMRVSSAGWLYETLEETRHVAALTAEVTHNHPEGIKGAEAAASAIFLARNGSSKEEIRNFITAEFGYDLTRTCDEIRPAYHHVETCQETVPEAMTAFLEGTDFEDVIRTAVSLGGDCDTLTCIAGGIAEAFYGVPKELQKECRRRLQQDMLAVLDRFEKVRIPKDEQPLHDFSLDGNELIEDAITNYCADHSRENQIAVLEAIRKRMHEDGHFIFPVFEEEDGGVSFPALQSGDGKLWQAAFTSQVEYEKGESGRVLSYFIDNMMKHCMESEMAGIVVNPWGQSFRLTKELMKMIFDVDGDVEYHVPEDEITAELLEDGSFLKRALGICSRNNTQMNMIRLLKILRDSWVWVPCNMVMSDADYAKMEKIVLGAAENDALDSLVGKTLTNRDEVRMVPDILQNGEDYFFPVFTTVEEMGEYGEQFSKIERHFLEATNLARNNKRNVRGIVINAFTEPFVIPRELFDLVAGMESSLKEKEES